MTGLIGTSGVEMRFGGPCWRRKNSGRRGMVENQDRWEVCGMEGEEVIRGNGKLRGIFGSGKGKRDCPTYTGD